MLSITNVAKILGVHRATVYRMVKDGRIKSVSLGKLIRIDESEIQNIVENGILMEKSK